jgi:ferredoxin
LGVLLLRTDLRARRKDSLLIRPPGAQDEPAFLSACLRCAQCMKICPTSALQPAAFEAGLEGLWTPVLMARVGYCDYGCHACGQVCPSGAIPELSLEQKRDQVIGKASVDRDRCLPWASATPCIVCEEMCPTPQKSIRLEEATLPGADGQPVTVQRPVVLRDVCIGCGICENHCPLEGEAGIRVYGV